MSDFAKTMDDTKSGWLYGGQFYCSRECAPYGHAIPFAFFAKDAKCRAMTKHSRSLGSLDSARNSLGDEVAKEIRRSR